MKALLNIVFCLQLKYGGRTCLTKFFPMEWTGHGNGITGNKFKIIEIFCRY